TSAGEIGVGSAPSDACSSPPTVAASASSVRVWAATETRVPGGAYTAVARAAKTSARCALRPASVASPASSTTAASMPSGTVLVASWPASSTGRSSCTASPRYADPRGVISFTSRERDRRARDARDHERRGALDVARGRDALEAVEQRVEHRPDLDARERGAE